MPFTLGEALRGEAALRRDAAFDRTDFATATEGRALAFAADEGYLRRALEAPGVAALIVPPGLERAVPERLGLAVAEDAQLAFYLLHNRLAEAGMGMGLGHEVDASARVHPSAVIEPGCRIGPGVEVGPGAVVMAGTVLGAGAIVGPRAVVGAEGLFSIRRPGRVLKVRHAGGVHVGPEAEIQVKVTVGRAVHPGFTRIGARALVSTGATISHGDCLGEDVTVGGGAVICGFTRVGARSWIGPNATVANLIEIGADARVGIGATVVRSVPAGGRYSGIFARSHAVMQRMSRALEMLAKRSNG